MVKSRLHWPPGSSQPGLRLPTKVVFTKDDAAERVAHIRAVGGEPLLQEIVRGRIMHCHLLMERDGRMITCVKQLSEPLQLPPERGTRVRSQTVPTEESVAQGCASFLTESRVVRVCKHSVHAARCRPSSSGGLNGRLSLSFEQTIVAGINFPAVWACIATGRDYGGVQSARMGVRFQWLEGDIQRC